MEKPVVHVACAGGRHTLASPRYDKEDEVKLEALGYHQVRATCGSAGAAQRLA